nr:hypothetical protein [Catellatospora methionotrophica]
MIGVTAAASRLANPASSRIPTATASIGVTAPTTCATSHGISS